LQELTHKNIVCIAKYSLFICISIAKPVVTGNLDYKLAFIFTTIVVGFYKSTIIENPSGKRMIPTREHENIPWKVGNRNNNKIRKQV
jgi:hypothetical protein